MIATEETAGSLKSWAAGELAHAQVPTPALDSEILLAHVTGYEKIFLVTHPEKEIEPGKAEIFRSLIKRRKELVPVAYLTGVKEFFSLDFMVTQDTLIPRPETEMATEEILKRYSDVQCLKVLEIGTGSGAIAVTLAVHRPGWTFVATDISDAALDVARANAANHNVAGQIEFIRSDVYDSLAANKFDVIVSNPPYIPDGDENMAFDVALHEPHQALFAGADGLDVIRKIIDGAPGHLNNGGSLVMEIGFGQSGQVAELIKQNDSLSMTSTLPDLAGIDRVVVAVKK